jgi:hypothetical protein
MEKQVASNYILENFEAPDRIAVVLLDKRTGAALQRIAAAERIAAPQYQAWLRHMNARKHEVYISMNTLRDGAQRRTKEDVERIRHVYLDFDEDGTTAVEALLRRDDLPQPNYLLNSSRDKWQVIWKIQNCSREQAEAIERALVQHTGADPAVIDVARVLRLPGFYNHKYPQPHLVSVENRSRETCKPEQFQHFAPQARAIEDSENEFQISSRQITQSERDWANVRDAIRRGGGTEELIEELKARRSDKFNPEDYAKRTVDKARASLQRGLHKLDSNAH